MADQEFLASFAVEIDEGGVSRLQAVLEENRELAENLASAFDAATAAIRTFSEELGLLPAFSGGLAEEGFSGLGGLTLGLNTEAAEQDLQSFIALAKKPVALSANASGIVSAARSAYTGVKSLFSTPVTLKVNVERSVSPLDPGDSPLIPMSAGGRFTRPTDVQVAEDGDAEYIIPVKKEDRALPLLRQLLSELSPAARAQLGNSEFRIQNSELNGEPGNGNAGLPQGGEANLSSLSARVPDLSAAGAGSFGTGNISMDNRTVSAPVNIQVHASGANAEQIGESIYDTAERYLVRTLQGVMA